MNVLVTSSRMPFALDEIRKLGHAGHHVYAADTFYSAPGSHSRWVTSHFEVTPPQSDAQAYVADIAALVGRYAISLIVPCFEEVFYLARYRQRLAPARLFAPDFPLLTRLHHKATFSTLASGLGLPAAATVLVRDERELAEALARTPRYVARPAWSRGGLEVLASDGPLAGLLHVSDCKPTAAWPWVVQEYIDGVDLCGFSVARDGRVVAHCTYRHPKEIEHAGGIVFESVLDDEVVAFMQQLVAATGYDGQVSVDFRRGPRGLAAIECNPRPTAGVHLMPGAMLVDAILADPAGDCPGDVDGDCPGDAAGDCPGDAAAVGDQPPQIVPAGARRMYASALVRDAVVHPRELGADLAYLFSDAADVYAEKGDRVPALYQVLSYSRVISYRLRHHADGGRSATKLMAAYFDGISWNGQPI